MTVQVGPFELDGPPPELKQPRLLLSLQPWIDVGSVGTMALALLEERWGAKELGRLSRPGTFYDFSRYRPMLFRQGGERQVAVPNTVLHAAKAADGKDWLLLHALEPHNHGEDFVDALLSLLTHFGVSEYCLVGSMYAPVPHTRPPVVSGGATSDALRDRLRAVGIRESNYEGPTTILATLPARATAGGIETATIIVQLPAYAQMERDYRGLNVLLELLSRLYDLDLDLETLCQESDRQRATMDEATQQNPQLQAMMQELERVYDSDAAEQPNGDGAPKLSPELEGFLKDIEKRLGDSSA